MNRNMFVVEYRMISKRNRKIFQSANEKNVKSFLSNGISKYLSQSK